MLFKLILSIVIVELLGSDAVGNVKERQRRYLIFPPSTQYGVFITVSVPLPEPDNLVSVAWFFEANYYNVANATWFEPLLGDIETSKSREKRAVTQQKEIRITRNLFYTFIESMLEKQEYSGRSCLLRSICETSTSHFSHNGIIGDVIHLILTPSTSQDEDIDDSYYEAEYHGLDGQCGRYHENCPLSPLEDMSMFIDH